VLLVSKTASIRLEKELFDKIDEHCVTKNCSRNDFVKSSIKSALGNKDDDVVRKPYYDSYGNYFTWDKEEKTWVCHLNMKNVKFYD